MCDILYHEPVTVAFSGKPYMLREPPTHVHVCT